MSTKPVLYRITAPETSFSGDVGGCHFANGVYEGEVGDGPLAYFQGQGYGVEESKTPRRARAAGGDVDVQAAIDKGIADGIAAYKAEAQAAAYDAMTNDELKAELAERSLPVSGNHAELVARLIEADTAATDDENGEPTND